MSFQTEPATPLPEWLRTELPFDRHAARIAGDRITFIAHGPTDGIPVLLIHGNPTWSFLWRKVIGRLSGFRVIAPDLVGFGTSDKPLEASAQQLDRHVDQISQLVEGLGAERFIAVGQDWGGPVAAGVAARLEDRLGGVVFGNTAVLKPARPFRPKAFHRFSHIPIVSDLVFRGTLFPVPIMSVVQGDRRTIGFRETAAYAWPFLSPLARAGALGMARMIPNTEDHPTTAPMDRIGSFVESWRGPASLLWGTNDPLLGRGLRRHKAAMPQASVCECEAGHFSQEEVPDLWAAAIRQVADQL